MFDDLLEQVTVLKGRGKPFVLATVVACKPPTSAKAGAKAVVQPTEASTDGWRKLCAAAGHPGNR